MAERWYAAHVQTGAMNAVERGLTRLGCEFRSPGVPLRRRVFGRTTRPVFPGYVFLRFDLAAAFPWERINRTEGVIHLLPVKYETPLPLPEGFVEGVCEDVTNHPDPSYSPREFLEKYLSEHPLNSRIAVDNGPWAGHEGTLDRFHKDHFWVVMALLGREITVPIPPHQVLPARA